MVDRVFDAVDEFLDFGTTVPGVDDVADEHTRGVVTGTDASSTDAIDLF